MAPTEIVVVVLAALIGGLVAALVLFLVVRRSLERLFVLLDELDREHERAEARRQELEV